MPGIVGFTNGSSIKEKAKEILNEMQMLVTHQNYYIKDDLFSDEYVSATRSHINVIQKDKQPFSNSGIHVWIDGEFYNQNVLLKKMSNTVKTDPSILLEMYKKNNDFNFLKEIDGIYSAVIYDSNEKKIHLISDRYGLRHLYWTRNNDYLAWGSEVKIVLALNDFKPQVDRLAVDQFINIGYILENRTFLDGVELVPSGTVLTWDINRLKLDTFQYWWWDHIRPLDVQVSEDDIAEELGRLFIDSVKRRSINGEDIGLQLSGGLDSRAILAAMPTGRNLNTLSYGKEGCDDVRFAKMAAKVKGAKQKIYELKEDNWLDPRIRGVWWTDGQEDLMHMHGIVAIEDDIRSDIKINLNGFLGDAVLGGSYIPNSSTLDCSNDDNTIAKFMNTTSDMLEGFDKYTDLGKSDYYLLQNRGRRWVFGGTKLTLTGIEHRKPFFDNNLIELIYSLPDKLRFNSYIYNKMLIRTFPKYFMRIPWAKTGVPISWPNNIVNIAKFTQKLRHKFGKEITRFGLKYNNPNNYTDYANWIRREPIISFINKLLSDPNALYTEFISREKVLNEWKNHLNGINNETYLFRYLTFEIWLQQVFNKKYRE